MDLITFVFVSIFFAFGVCVLFILRYISSRKIKKQHEEVRMKFSGLKPTIIKSVPTVDRSNGLSTTYIRVRGNSDVLYTLDLLAILPVDRFLFVFDEYYSPVLISTRAEYWQRLFGSDSIYPYVKVGGTIPHSGVLFEYLRSQDHGGVRGIELKNLEVESRERLLAFFTSGRPPEPGGSASMKHTGEP